MMKEIIRSLLRHKSSTALSLVGLSLAFAAFIIITMQVQHHVRYDKTYSEHERIGQLFYQDSLNGSKRERVKGSTLLALQDQLPEIQYVCAQTATSSFFGVENSNGEYDYYREESIQANNSYLKIFSFEIIQGDTAGLVSPDQVVIAESIARKYFPNSSAIGKKVRFDKAEQYIVAVFKDFPINSSLSKTKIVRRLNDTNLANQRNRNYISYGKLHPNSSFEEVNQKLGSIAASLDEAPMVLIPIAEVQFEKGANRNYPVVIFSIALLIVIVASINYINFSMSLIPIKIKAINLRKVVGAQEWQLRRGMIAESVILSLGAFALGVGWVELFKVSALERVVSADMSFLDNYSIYLITLGIAVLTGLLSSLYPSFITTSFKPAIVLKSNFALSLGGRKMRYSLIGFQFFVSIGLITVTSIMQQQYEYLLTKDTGYQKEGVLYIEQGKGFNSSDLFREELIAHPNIVDMTYSYNAFGASESGMTWGREYSKGVVDGLEVLAVYYNFLDFFSIKMNQGRGFVLSDHTSENGYFIMNQTAQDRYQFEEGELIEGHKAPTSIIGTCADFHLYNLKSKILPMALYCFGSSTWGSPKCGYIKAEGNISAAIKHIRKVYREINPNSPTLDVRFFTDEFKAAYEKEENLRTMIALFSFIAIAIALGGVFGLVSFDTRYRRREIAVRRVNGATIRQILQMFSFTYLKIVVVSFALSTPVCYLIVQKWLQQFPYRIEIQAWAFIIPLLIVAALTFSVAVLQSYQSATQNPYQVIKSE